MTPFYPDEYEFFVVYERALASPLRRMARWYGLRKRTSIVIQASNRSTGNLLAIGCASGAFLSAMHDRGWSVQGVDPSLAAVAIAKQRGLKVHHSKLETAGLETAGLAPAQFDVLTMWDVLEHVPDPLRVLRAAAEVLKPAGVLVIRIPNPLGLDAALFKHYWTRLDLPRHHWLFTWSKLQLLLEQAGFSNIRRRWDYSSYHMWRYSIGFWLDDHVPPWLARLLRSCLNSPLTQLAVWPFFRAIQKGT